jgi:hypothetical protein
MTMTWKKGLAAAAAAGSLACAAVAAIPAAPAYASDMYISRQCVLKAATGTGLQGRGCDLYGEPVWAENPLPHDLGGLLKKCAVGGLSAVILEAVARKPVEPLLFVGGCAAGLADAVFPKILGE